MRACHARIIKSVLHSFNQGSEKQANKDTRTFNSTRCARCQALSNASASHCRNGHVPGCERRDMAGVVTRAAARHDRSDFDLGFPVAPPVAHSGGEGPGD